MHKRIAALALALVLMLPMRTAADGQTPEGVLASSGAKGAVLMEAAGGRVLCEKDGDRPLAIASTTKIMTALLTLEQAGSDEYFVVDPTAIRVEGSSMGLTEGDWVTLRTLAWGMLLASGNDAANAAAVRISGGIGAFCAKMNARAAEIGMKDTRFESPSGLDAGNHHSTAYDMALLARTALSNDAFAQMVQSKSVQVRYGNPPDRRWLTNHNRLLWQCGDCIGLKTGFTQKAGRCLVSAARRDGLTLIAVTLGCPDDFTVHRQLYEAGFAALEYVDFTDRVANVSVPVTNSAESRVSVRALWPLGAYLTEAERVHCRMELSVEPFLYAPVRAQQVVGQATLLLDGQTLSVVPLVASRECAARFTETRSIRQQIRDFFDDPQHYGFPLNRRMKEKPRENTQGAVR